MTGTLQAGHRAPPHNIEAEESVLGAMLLSESSISNVLESLRPDDFYKPSHRKVFDAVVSLYGRGEPVDAVTVADELRRTGALEESGGKAYLFHLVNSVPAASNAKHYAKIVEETALLRRLIEASQQAAALAYDSADDVDHVVDQIEALVFGVAQRRLGDRFAHIRDLLHDHLEQVEKLQMRGSHVTGVPTGFVDLDKLTSGFQPSNLIIVAARPSFGKTSFALNIAQYAATEHQVPVAIFSLEMSKMELVQRLMCAEALVDVHKLRTGNLTDQDWSRIGQAAGRLADAPIYIDDTEAVTVLEIRAKARRLKQKAALGLVIVDYLQLMSGPRGRSENRQQEISEISRSLKILARELELPVLAVSQLSRNVEYRSDKRPMLADLRESGCLTGDTRILRADTGASVPISDLLGERDIPVWTLDRHLKLVRGVMTHVFPSGVKPVFRLRLRSGREVKASANHPFLALDGWKRLDELEPGARIAVPRIVYEPGRSTEWPEARIVLLAHLIGDGCFVDRQPLHYTNADPANLDAVTNAARAFGVTARTVQQRNWWHVYLPSPYRLTHGRHNPIVTWLRKLGIYGKRSREKFIPDPIFRLTTPQVGLFLRHLWATDGHFSKRPNGAVALYYASGSRRLIEDVRMLLLRFGIHSHVVTMPKAGYLPTYGLHVTGAEHQIHFLEEIGIHGERGLQIPDVLEHLRSLKPNTNIDTVPADVWIRVRDRMAERSVNTRDVAAALGTPYLVSTPTRGAPGRARLGFYADLLEDEDLKALATSDVFWDEVKDIEPLGEMPVFDGTVPGTHNFVADGITVENSIEQDSDVVMFIYRDEVYNPDTTDKGTAEVLVAKHRNGPVGKLRLTFLENYTKFANFSGSPGR